MKSHEASSDQNIFSEELKRPISRGTSQGQTNISPPKTWRDLLSWSSFGSSQKPSPSSSLPIEELSDVEDEIPRYQPPTLEDEIDWHDILDEGVKIEGDQNTPAQKQFFKIFPWKANQLRLALKHGEGIGQIAEKRWASPDAIAYSEATDKLVGLSIEAAKIDLINNITHIKGGRHTAGIAYLTGLNRAPHAYLEEPQYQPIQQSFQDDAEALLITAKHLGFTIKNPNDCGASTEHDVCQKS